MKRIWALTVAVLTAAVILTACGGEQPVETTAPPEEQVEADAVPFSLPYYENASLHPITGKSQTNLTLAPLVYEGLFEVDNSFQANAVLAKSWEEDETGLVWTIRIKETVFSDGSPLTGADVAASLELARTSELYAARLSDVQSVTAEGNTVTITLSHPRGDLPILLDIPIVRERGEGLPPLGTGRYAYQMSDEGLRLKGTDRLTEGAPEEIPLTLVQGADDLIYAFDTKDISLVTADLTGTDALGFSGGYEVWDHPTTTMLYLGFRTDSGACQNVSLRQAISCALDRETIVNALYARHARAAVLPVSPVSEYYDQTVADSVEYTKQHAEELLAEAEYRLQDGKLYQGYRAVSLRLIVSADNSFRVSAAEYIAQELGKLGLTVTVEKLPWQDYVDRLTRGEFDLYLAETMLTADFDLSAILGSAGPINYSRWGSVEGDALLEVFRSASGMARKSAATELYRYLQEQSPIAPICFKEQTVLTQWGQVTGLTPTRANAFAGWEWQVGGSTATP